MSSKPFVLALALVWGGSLPAAETVHLFQKPALSRTRIVFTYAGDLWSVPRDGGEARQLTTGPGTQTDAVFSPDGQTVAFSGMYDGNTDVYVMPAEGGVPRRLTYHPGADIPVGWTNDGRRILFRSQRNSYSRFSRLFTISADGEGLPEELPLSMAEDGAYSPDGGRLAYTPLAKAFDSWKRYRGGRTSPLWIANLADSRIEKVPRENSNDFRPMWIGKEVYFLSDRGGPITLFAYDPGTKKVRPVLKNDGLDIKSACAGPGAIVYEQFGAIHLFDVASGKEKEVPIRLAGDLASVRPSFVKVQGQIRAARLSPSGVRGLFEARGDIFTIPAEKGDVRNLTQTPGVAERDPAWSPDGRHIAYFSDESGEYALHIAQQNGTGDVRKINLAEKPTFYYDPVWSPDSKKIAYTSKGLDVWYVDLEKGAPVKIDTDTYHDPGPALAPVWSPDSRWIAYNKQLKNHLRAVFAYSLEEGKSRQITDGMSDARFATFDKDGEKLYFAASTDYGPTTGWLDMSSMNRPVTRSVYVVVLRSDGASPLAPESDEEKAADAAKKPEEKKEDAEKKDVKVRIDFDKIGQRILAMPVPARNYAGLAQGKAGTLYLFESDLVPQPGPPAGVTVQKYDFKTRKLEKFLDGVNGPEFSFNGEKVLYRKGQQWFIAGTAEPPKAGEGALKLDAMEARVDPKPEWRQIYREVWRIERDFFYDPGAHGLDLKAAEKKYEPYLEAVASRADLNYLFTEMLGELSVGHLYVNGGAMPDVKRVKGGLLGADYAIENGRYRFKRVYDGENWNPQLKAPLTQPAVNVAAGEYLLAVNGRDLRAADNLYARFENTAGQAVTLRVGPDPGGSGARDVTVVPVEDEFGLRNLAWIEDNRRKVDALSGGRLAYVYLPNTAGAGYSNFNRYYFAQVDKLGAVIDERFNGGGMAADYIVDYMRRPLMNYWTTRDGQDFTTPVGSIFGPKAMIVNEYAGSGGDAMPWYFRKAGVGPLVGKRTWGGLVGIYDFPQLIDGGGVTAPNLAFWSPKGEWDVENHGVAPDVEVEQDPFEVRQGHDPQLEKAVAVVLAALEKNPPPAHKKPAYPNYHTAPRPGR